LDKRPKTGVIIRGGGEGERRWYAGGGLHVWKARAEETGGAFHAFEDHLVRGKMTPLHVHPHADDTIYVLEGEVLYHAGGEQHCIGRGGMATALRGTPHAFMVTSETARLFCVMTPGDGDGFYLDASDPLSAETEADGSVDLARLARAAADHPTAVKLLGPPPFAGVPAGR
jgi:quercetin dioxygenase-like cupin family protein